MTMDLLEALREQEPSGPFGAYTGNRNRGVEHFPGYDALCVNDQIVVNEVREHVRPSALIAAVGCLYWIEYEAAGEFYEGGCYGYTVRTLCLTVGGAPPRHEQSDSNDREADERAPPRAATMGNSGQLARADAPVGERPAPAEPEPRREVAPGPPPAPPTADAPGTGGGKFVVVAVLLALAVAGGFLGGVAWYQEQNLRGMRDAQEESVARHKEVVELHKAALKSANEKSAPAIKIDKRADDARVESRLADIDRKLDRVLELLGAISTLCDRVGQWLGTLGRISTK